MGKSHASQYANFGSLLIIHIKSEYHYQNGNDTKSEKYITVLVLHYL
mgnify:CR=1 FL=1